ncbi:MAG: phosphatase PAP2 family protein [Slackia sp.]|nr:phosphatase PAP2 family protein [Slackia sp.]
MPVMLETITNIDLSILHAIREYIATPALDALMPVITSLGNMAFVWLIVAVALLCTKRYRTYGIAVVVAVCMTSLFGEVFIKNIVERARPFLVDPTLDLGLIPPPSTFSFPSGHTGSSFAAATALCLIPLRHAWLRIAPLLGACLIAFSRLYLCVHFPSDICGGIIVGTICGVAAFFLVKKIAAYRARATGRA